MYRIIQNLLRAIFLYKIEYNILNQCRCGHAQCKTKLQTLILVIILFKMETRHVNNNNNGDLFINYYDLFIRKE